MDSDINSLDMDRDCEVIDLLEERAEINSNDDNSLSLYERTERSRAEKRIRVVDEEEVWTEVGRRGKVVARSASDDDMTRVPEEQIEISMTSKKEKLPKQLGLARILKQENILDIIRVRISGYNIVRKDRDDGYGGVAIIVHASIKYQLSKIYSTNPGIQLIHLKLLNCFQIENIIAIYCPSSVQTTTSDWDYIFGIYNNKTLIAGDFNAHHSNWSYKTDNRGSQLFDVLLDKNYITLNDGSPTRIKLVNGSLQKSSPDITLVTSDIALKFTWAMSNESLGSDHLIIKYSLCNNNQSPNFVRKRNFKKANWNGYSSFLQSIFSVLILAADPQEAYNQFVDAINTAANIYIPPVNICQDPLRLKKFVPKSYWNVDISRSIAERRLALAIFRKNPTPHNLSNLQAKIASARRTIRKAKREAWRKFCSSINEIVSLSEMCRRMRWLKGYRLPRANIDETIASKLLRNLSPDYVSPDKPSFTSSNQALESIITLHELNLTSEAIKSV
ncbi:unnamed protein product, partial [Brenthis ino]